ncbi:MAG TPA: DnaA/Hda family protein [Acetobacteraceae bacterium]|nr:DnaA/Hda family protein [Acetobacteraceae bacterium]
MRCSGQLVLSIFRGPRLASADFRPAPSNEQASAWLRRTVEWPDRRLALWGDAGCGKTHLLHIWAERTGAVLHLGAELAGVPGPLTSGVAVDEADAAGEEALLHLLNAALEARQPVLLAARTPPARWPVRLPDLASRLRAVTAVEIGPPEDTLIQALLARLLHDRQLRLPPALLDWLALRVPRSAAAVRQAVERLDAMSLDSHRTITVPFAAEALADLLAPDEISGTAALPSQNGEVLK